MNSLKVLMFQFKLEIESDSTNEYPVNRQKDQQQFLESFKIIEQMNPDIIVYPEICYQDDFNDRFIKLSQDRIIVAGSQYIDGINTTIIYQNSQKFLIPKKYVSGAEPAVRNVEEIDYKTFMEKYLSEHTFEIKNQKIIVLNCAEYYQVAYYIARNLEDFFGFIVPCMNNNTTVFEEETRAIHNHNETIYSFVLNSIATLNGIPYSKGKSYVYGPIQGHEREWLQQEGMTLPEHNAGIIIADREPVYIYGEFIRGTQISRFGRSDRYYNNPKNLKMKDLKEGIKMKKKIIITAGPTNERIDSVMKITNMSTGSLGSIIADELINDEEIEIIYYIGPKLIHTPREDEKVKRIFIESTDDLLQSLTTILQSEKIHTVIHSSAVGDYTGEFVIRAEDLAKELNDKLKSLESKDDLYNLILSVLTSPNFSCDDSTKISSYEPNLMVKLGLTPKVIGSIKKLSPDTKLIGFKLLDSVSKEKLYEVAHALLLKNGADYIIANDLSKIGHGKHWAMIIDKDHIVEECESKKEIAEKVHQLIKTM